MSGLHASMFVASGVLLAGSLLILAFVQPTFHQAAKNSPAST